MIVTPRPALLKDRFMVLQRIRERLDEKSIFFSEDRIYGRPTVIGYDKKFRLRWIATQLNTFIVASDFGGDVITVKIIEEFLTESFDYARTNYRGWPRGLQSAVGVIAILVAENVDEEAITYCRQLQSGKKWAGFSIPVIMDSSTSQVYAFDNDPVWGRMYYPYFRKMIRELTGADEGGG